MLREEFAQFGEIESVKIETETIKKGDKEYSIHKGYGFVSFVRSEDALNAIEKMNGKELVGKPL